MNHSVTLGLTLTKHIELSLLLYYFCLTALHLVYYASLYVVLHCVLMF